jgi:DNA-directed RNA polymerase III subunit RPC2
MTLAQNRAIIELDPKNNVSAAITSSTHDRKSRCSIVFKNQKVPPLNPLLHSPPSSHPSQLYLKHNSLGDEVPMMVVLKAMGMESDQETVQLIGTEDDILDILSPTLEEPYNMGIYTQEQVPPRSPHTLFSLSSDISQALKFIGEKVSAARLPSSSNRGTRNMPPVADAAEILANLVLNHVPVVNFNFRPKVRVVVVSVSRPHSLRQIIYITHIIRRVLKTVLDPSLLDDKVLSPLAPLHLRHSCTSPPLSGLLWQQATRARWLVDFTPLRRLVQEIQH